MKRYEGRINQFRQSKLFQNNQKRLFEELEGNERNVNIMPDAEKSRKFGVTVGARKKRRMRMQCNVDVENIFAQKNKQENMAITPKLILKQVVKLPNWKAPGPDGLQGYCLKHSKSVRPTMAALLNDCLQQGDVPSWLTQGSTTLIMKDESKGAEVSNFRPITCLPLMWKVLTGIISKGIYAHLDRENILPQEQKGCRKESKGTKDLLLIDKMVLKNCKRRQTDLAMGWIDYTKAYDIVPDSWILKFLEVTEAADNVIMLMNRSMSKWQTELLSGKQKLGKVRIQRGIFQDDSLSPMLFVVASIPLSIILEKVNVGYDLGKGKGCINHLLVMDDLKLYGNNMKQLDTLINTVRIFSSDIGRKFGLQKCGVLMTKRGNHVSSNGVKKGQFPVSSIFRAGGVSDNKKLLSRNYPFNFRETFSLANKRISTRSENSIDWKSALKMTDNEELQEIDKDQGHEYLGVLEVDKIKDKEMKEKIQKEYFRRVKKISKSKLNSGNTTLAINSRAASLIRYGAGIIAWTKNELQKIDRKARKLMTGYGGFHKQGDID